MFKIRMTECDVCCLRLNDKKTNKQVECPYCHYKCCQSCFQRYLLSVTQQNCMNCRMMFSDNFIQSVLPKIFLNGDLAYHKQSIFMMKENETLKIYEHLVPKYKRQHKDLTRIKKLSSEIHRLEFRSKTKPIDHFQLFKLKEEKQTIIDNGYNLSDGCRAKNNKSRLTFGPKCPIEGCKGHTVVNGNNYRCQICESDVCKKCLSKVTNKEHVCNPSDVKSLELILRDSKPCPKCGIMIFRESGCPAMFCTNCTISFNWNTLEIEAPSHNPHYYQWLEQSKQNKYVKEPLYSYEELLLMDQTDLPDYQTVTDSVVGYRHQYEFVVECHRLANEIKDILSTITYDESEMELLRIKFLIGEITETKFAQRMIILQRELDYYNHQRESIRTVYELLKTDFWKLICRECSIDDFMKNAHNIFDAYSKDQIETADEYNKKYTTTKKTYGDVRITYVIMKDFEDSMKQRTTNINNNFVGDDTPDYWSDYDSDF